jgi:hypothetical protein
MQELTEVTYIYLSDISWFLFLAKSVSQRPKNLPVPSRMITFEIDRLVSEARAWAPL